MTIADFVKQAEISLGTIRWYERREVRSIISTLLVEVAGVESYKIITDPQMQLSDGVSDTLRRMVGELSCGRPLQYVLGYTHFCGKRFNVREGVLIPRPETEELVNLLVGKIENLRHILTDVDNTAIVDLCTGSGVIAWSVADAMENCCTNGKPAIFGYDISDEALAIAEGQRENFPGLAAHPSFFKCDLLQQDAECVIRETMDGRKAVAIVSNPPYVCESERSLMRPNVLDYEPERALFVPDEDPMLFYRRISELASDILLPGGLLLFEINERFANRTVAQMEEYGFTKCNIITDLFGKERMVTGEMPAKG